MVCSSQCSPVVSLPFYQFTQFWTLLSHSAGKLYIFWSHLNWDHNIVWAQNFYHSSYTFFSSQIGSILMNPHFFFKSIAKLWNRSLPILTCITISFKHNAQVNWCSWKIWPPLSIILNADYKFGTHVFNLVTTILSQNQRFVVQITQDLGIFW